MPSSRVSSQPRDWTQAPAVQVDSLPTEYQGSPPFILNPHNMLLELQGPLHPTLWKSQLPSVRTSSSLHPTSKLSVLEPPEFPQPSPSLMFHPITKPDNVSLHLPPLWNLKSTPCVLWLHLAPVPQVFLPQLPPSPWGTCSVHPHPNCLHLLWSSLTSLFTQEHMLLHVKYAFPVSPSPYGLPIMLNFKPAGLFAFPTHSCPLETITTSRDWQNQALTPEYDCPFSTVIFQDFAVFLGFSTP